MARPESLYAELPPAALVMRPPGTGFFWRLTATRAGRWSLAAVAAILLIALLVPALPIQDPLQPDYNTILAPPSGAHLLGTDLHGRDQLARLLWASRTSLLVGITATALALGAGLTAGGAAGYGGRLVDVFLMRIADIFLSFPVIIGAIAIMAVLGAGRRNVFIAIALFGWPVFARVFRSSVLSTRERNFVKATAGLGASRLSVFVRHVLPNSVTPLVSYSSMMVAAAIMAEAGLSYINLGVQRPDPAWGLMLADATGQIEQSPWLLAAPAAAIIFTALIFILLGTAASAALAPSSYVIRRTGRKH